MDGLFWRREGQESWYGQKNFYWPKTPMDQFTRDIPKTQWHRTEVSVEIRKFYQANNVSKNVNIGILILNKMDNMCMCIYVYIRTCTCVCEYIYIYVYTHTQQIQVIFNFSFPWHNNEDWPHTKPQDRSQHRPNNSSHKDCPLTTKHWS